MTSRAIALADSSLIEMIFYTREDREAFLACVPEELTQEEALIRVGLATRPEPKQPAAPGGGTPTRSAHRNAVSGSRVTTLAEIPGHRAVRVLGIISNLSASSGFTATTKGNTALGDALVRLREDAARMGANAIVGLSGGPFGAAGGITSAFGGDAVGILLMGTAVVVEPLPDSPPAAG